MTKKETAARKIMVGLVKLPRTPIKTVAEFITAHGLEGIGSSDVQGLTWAAQARLYDAFQKAARLRGEYGQSFQKIALATIASVQSKRALTHMNQIAARLLVIEMVKLARTPVKTIAEFIVMNGVSGISIGESHGLSQVAHDRLYASFKTARHIRLEAKRAGSLRKNSEEHGTATPNNRVPKLLNNEGHYASS